jgi:hypothetical protein
MHAIVIRLMAAGLLRADNAEDRELNRAKIRVTELFLKIQAALGLSVTLLASIDPYRSIVVDPLFGKPYLLDEAPTCLFSCHSRPTCEPFMRITLSQRVPA